MIGKLGFSGSEVGSVYATMGIASLFMPALLGIVADKWLNAERVLGLCHLLGAGVLVYASTITDSTMMFWAMLFNSMMYMPTIGLSNTVSYNALEKGGGDVVKDFPPIRIWGTIGFIAAMWTINLAGFKGSEMQFYVAAIAAIVLGLYSFTLPACEPSKLQKNGSLMSAFGLDALVLFKQYKMVVFFLFAVLLGAALQVTNLFGEPFLDHFKLIPEYADAFAVKYSVVLLSLSQMSETFCILLIPFFLKRFGIKKVMLMSMVAWVLRFGLFAFGEPTGLGLGFLIMSMIVYGLAFDFFNISGSLFVEMETSPTMRASAQGLFILMTNGLGTIIGTKGSGYLMDLLTKDNVTDYKTFWLILAAYALVVGILFALVFRYKHDPSAIKKVNH